MNKKFSDPLTTLSGQKRASVVLNELETLWFNTGTLCNLTCENCYIESSPRNDRLVYLEVNDVIPYLDEIKSLKLKTSTISFTGGEPFLNPSTILILEECLRRGFDVLVLTNAYRVLDRHKKALIRLNQIYPQKMTLRVSLDHHTKELHEKHRGKNTFDSTLESICWIDQNNIPLTIAGRSLTQESPSDSISGYMNLLEKRDIHLNPDDFVIFPEMDESIDVPEISVDCWGILNKTPKEVMCSNSRMVVKRKGEDSACVLACTLLAYDPEFELGKTLNDSKKEVYLNHPHCAKFCVLGGAKCSQ